MSQASDILDRLRAGETITPADAYEQHGTLALHSIAASLRKELQPLGWDIECRIVVNGVKRWGEYRLVYVGPDPRQGSLFRRSRWLHGPAALGAGLTYPSMSAITSAIPNI